MKHYEEGTEVFYWDYNDTLKEGIVDSFDADEYGADYYIKDFDGRNLGHIAEKRVDVDKKNLLLRMLLESDTGASEAKQAMVYYNERANNICWILWGIDKNMNIKKELDDYEKEHGE